MFPGLKPTELVSANLVEIRIPKKFSVCSSANLVEIRIPKKFSVRTENFFGILIILISTRLGQCIHMWQTEGTFSMREFVRL
jgi:hypothetical protein